MTPEAESKRARRRKQRAGLVFVGRWHRKADEERFLDLCEQFEWEPEMAFRWLMHLADIAKKPVRADNKRPSLLA